MRPVLINLTDEYVAYLADIKKTHGISRSSYIRSILKADMERALNNAVVIEERSEEHRVTKYRRRIISRRQTDPRHIELMKELKPKLAAWRERADRHVVLRQSARTESNDGEVEDDRVTMQKIH